MQHQHCNPFLSLFYCTYSYILAAGKNNLKTEKICIFLLIVYSMELDEFKCTLFFGKNPTKVNI